MLTWLFYNDQFIAPGSSSLWVQNCWTWTKLLITPEKISKELRSLKWIRILHLLSVIGKIKVVFPSFPQGLSLSLWVYSLSSFTALFHSRHLKSVYGLRMKKVWLSFSTSSISKCGLWLPQLGMTSVPLCSEVLSLRCCVNRFFVSCQLGWMELELSWSVRGHE